MDYATLGKEPIPGENPAGSDCRYETAFETLQAEIDKLASPTAEGKVDWAKVTQWAADILAGQSKDLTVASYLAVGLVRERQVKGLDEGIQVFKDLVENFWDTMYPPKKRMRGREGALAWWLEKTEDVLTGLNPDPLAVDLAQRLQENIRILDGFLAEKMPEPPLLRPLQRQIERFPVQKAEPLKEEVAAKAAAVPAESVPSPAERAAPAATAPPAQTGPAVEVPLSVATDQDANKGIDTAIQLFRKASHFLLQQDLKNPSAYRYRRMAGWVRIEELPPNKDGVTQIPPPAPQILSPIMELREAANWPALIENVEQRISQFVFWFDLHFMVAEGLKNLGSDYKPALKAVCQETAYFLQRLPGVENLNFSDEMPFADAQTRKWLAGIGLGSTADGVVTESSSSDGCQERIAAMTQDALAMARKKRVAEGVDLLFQQMRRASARSEQTRWRLAIAQVLLASKKGPSALPHLEQVIADIDMYKLEQWDPALALEGLSLAWKGFSSEGAKANQSLVVELLNRIARLNPVEALRMAP
jgi:type VI secretion system protein VasJ